MHRAPTGRETLLPYSAKAKPKRRRARAAAGLLGKLLIGVGAVLLLYGLYQHSSRENGTLRWKPLRKLETVTEGAVLKVLAPEPPKAHTLVIYVFSGSDPEYEHNLRYFIRTAIKERDGCEYVIIIQKGDGLPDFNSRPELPSNGRYMEHTNKCFDWGTYGWVLQYGKLNLQQYKYLLLLNSSARGPFLPAYAPPGFHWTHPFLNKITDKVKLVGSTINCGGAYGHPPVPHVQTYVVATDSKGLEILADAGTVFHCWENMAETVIHSELGASQAIVKAGFNLDSLMLRYQGLDWRDPQGNACNAGLNPIQNLFYDGINVDPLEVLFIKVKGSMKAAGWHHVAQAVKYDEWSMRSASRANLTQEDWDSLNKNEWQQKAPSIIEDATRRGADCFDVQFYVNANKFDLWWIMTDPKPTAIGFNHYLSNGVNEGRPVRWTC